MADSSITRCEYTTHISLHQKLLKIYAVLITENHWHCIQYIYFKCLLKLDFSMLVENAFNVILDFVVSQTRVRLYQQLCGEHLFWRRMEQLPYIKDWILIIPQYCRVKLHTNCTLILLPFLLREILCGIVPPTIWKLYCKICYLSARATVLIFEPCTDGYSRLNRIL